MSARNRMAGAAVLATAVWVAAFGQKATVSPIHFSYRAIAFRLDSCETDRRHAPETMACGVAVFDFNNDGYLDIFFANGADIQTLKKTSAKYSNRLFQNDGKGNFKDVTERAGLAGAGYDTGVGLRRLLRFLWLGWARGIGFRLSWCVFELDVKRGHRGV